MGVGEDHGYGNGCGCSGSDWVRALRSRGGRGGGFLSVLVKTCP